jgi:hypothetical protein
VLLAFFLASFPARNSDAWRHLATGRALVQGAHHFGTDPFAHTADGAYWVNPAWLTDLLAYGVYQAFGGDGLVVVKALLAALLAALLLGSCWHGGSRWVAALAVALSLAAMGPYLALRPTCLSYLLLGFTLWWVERAGRRPLPEVGGGGAAWWRPLAANAPLLVAFALWANLDEWFLLGPLTVGLFWLGGLLDARRERSAPRPAGLGLVALAGLAVCLLNPHHVRAFALPAAVGPSAAPELLQEILGPGQTLSPFAEAFWRDGLTPAALAYYLLALLGLLSFAAGAGNWRWARALVWVAFFLLSAYRAVAIPFFAVVAGPVLALNVGDYLARRLANTSPRTARGRRYAGLGQAATVLLLAAAAAAAWPGWLEGFPPEPRGWALEIDPSLEKAAAQIARWRADDRLPADARGFSPSPATADCLAWLCPEERAFPDGRPDAWPPEVVADYLALRRALVPRPTATERPDWEALRAILRKRKVTHLVLADPDDRRLVASLRTVAGSPDEWRLVHLGGRASVFAWHDPAGRAGAPALAVPALDLDRRAFRPPAGQTAPRGGPEHDPEPRTVLDAFCKPQPSRDVDRDEALVYLADFDARRPATVSQARSLLMNGLATGIIGLAAPPALPPGPAAALGLPVPLLRAGVEGPPRGRARLSPMRALAYQFLAVDGYRRDDGPPGLLFLAVRAARRAVRELPDDPAAHLLLGRAYLRLMRHSRERAAAAPGSALDELRKVQAITALATAARLRPGLSEAHMNLAAIYEDMGYLDLALGHVRELRKHERDGERLRKLQEKEQDLDGRVRDLLHRAETEGYGQEAVRRAQLAAARGLPARALEILVGADSTTLGREGALLEVRLLLLAGRAPEVRTWLDSLRGGALEGAELNWLRAQLAAARGDYALADRDLQAMASRTISLGELGLKDVPFRSAAAVTLGKFILDRAAPDMWLLHVDRPTLLNSLAALDQTCRGRADVVILRGMLALEAGQSGQAADLFRDGLSLWSSDPQGAGGLARHYLRLLEQAAEGGPGPAPRTGPVPP